MGNETTFDRRKFKELVLLLARASAEDERFGAVKLNKLLYFCDFEAYRKLGRPLTGATYQKLAWGPAAVEFLPMVEELYKDALAKPETRIRGEHEQRVTVAVQAPDMSVFSEEEKALIGDVVARLHSLDATGISDLVHEESAGWNLVNEFEPIPYRTAILSTQKIPREDIERAKQLAQERGWASIRP